jgi:hypothetical protein
MDQANGELLIATFGFFAPAPRCPVKIASGQFFAGAG